MSQRMPIIAIIGRPNVGKSTLFNRILGSKKAVVDDMPGVTRDRNYALIERFSIPFFLVDTGGLDFESEEEINILTREQALAAAKEADIILALFDGKAGLQPEDESLVTVLRKSNLPFQIVVNKIDGDELSTHAAEFYSLGVDSLSDISALHGRGVKALIESVLRYLPNYHGLLELAKTLRARALSIEDEAMMEVKNIQNIENKQSHGKNGKNSEIKEENPLPIFVPVWYPDKPFSVKELVKYLKKYQLLPKGKAVYFSTRDRGSEFFELEFQSRKQPYSVLMGAIRVALVGRPNVGKSTLFNVLTGENRAITSEIAGTTRDSLDVEIVRDGQNYIFVDTAGLRKKARISKKIEKFSVLRSVKAITDSDIAMVLLDATRSIAEQDSKIAGMAHDQGKGIVFVVNKWDLVEKTNHSIKEWEEKIHENFRFAPYAPVIFVSALTGRRCLKIIAAVKEAAEARATRIPTALLNKVIFRAIKKKPPSQYRGRPIRIYYASQVRTQPPVITVFTNHPKEIHFSYERYLKNCIRKEIKFTGVDLKLVFRRSS